MVFLGKIGVYDAGTWFLAHHDIQHQHEGEADPSAVPRKGIRRAVSIAFMIFLVIEYKSTILFTFFKMSLAI